MLVIIPSIFIVFILSYSNNKSNMSTRKLAVSIVALLLSLIPTFRNIESAAVDDLINYKNLYLRLPYQSYEYLWNRYQTGDLKDFGFSAFSKIFADMGIGVDLWMAIIAIIFAVAFSYFIHKYSKDLFISFLMLVALVFSFTLTGLRQTVALSFVLLAYRFIIEKKLGSFIFTVSVAALFHSTAILFFPAYFLADLKIGKRQFVAIAGAFVVSILFPGLFRTLISTFAWNEDIGTYSNRTIGLTWSGFLIYFIIYVFCYIFSCKQLNDNRVKTVFMNCSAVGLMFLAMSTVIAEAFRMSYYYNICSCALVSNVVYEMRNIKDKKFFDLIIPAVLIGYIFLTNAYSGLLFI